MAAVELSTENIKPILQQFRKLEVAGINGPNAVVLSGDLNEIKQLVVKLKEQDVRIMCWENETAELPINFVKPKQLSSYTSPS